MDLLVQKKKGVVEQYGLMEPAQVILAMQMQQHRARLE